MVKLWRSLVVLLSFPSILIGCAVMGGDMPVRVSGSVPNIGHEAGCTLNLVQAASGQIRSTRDVVGRFAERFVVEARSKAYYFVLACGAYKFRTQEYELGGRGSFNKSVELGAFEGVLPVID